MAKTATQKPRKPEKNPNMAKALAILVRPMQKRCEPSRAFRVFPQEFGNFFQVRHSSPTVLAGELPPKWQATKRTLKKSRVFPLPQICGHGIAAWRRAVCMSPRSAIQFPGLSQRPQSRESPVL